MSKPDTLAEPWHRPWPADGIQSVLRCPVCESARRELLYADLVDNLFRVAPGLWKLWRCTACESAYLDPRPGAASISMAYLDYFTHQPGELEVDASYDGLTPLRRLRRRLANGYLRYRFSSPARPASILGIFAAGVLTQFRRRLDYRYRHLPRPPAGGGRLLDVGCGSGTFLQLASSCGWNVIGLDPDAKASASRQDLEVLQGGIERFDGRQREFDVITLKHVIEHVHEPLAVLRRCRELLKPGGRLWLETPNVKGLGHERFGRSWYGLDPPRHLVLFNRASLEQALREAGFSVITDRPRPDCFMVTFEASRILELGLHYTSDLLLSRELRRSARSAAVRTLFSQKRRDYMVLIATA